MEPPKYFTSVAEIEEWAAKLTQSRHQKVLDMRVTKERLDGWLTKGLDGLKDHFLFRSVQETPISSKMLESLSRIIRLLEECSIFEQAATSDDTDEMLAFISVALVEIIHKRIRSSLGELPVSCRSDIKRVLMDLKLAHARLRQKVQDESV